MTQHTPRALFAVGLLLGCDLAPVPTTRTQPLAGLTVEPGEVLFALGPAGEPIVGTPLEDRRPAHLPTTYRLRVGNGALDLPPVTGAAFDPVHGELAWVSPDGELRVGPIGSQARSIAQDVQPGLSFAPDGGAVVFAAGIAPEFDVFIARRGAPPRALVAEPGPQYLPAFDATGGRVVFVSGGETGPSVSLVDLASGARHPLLLHDVEASPPDGVVAPAVSAERVAWFDGLGVTTVELATSAVATVSGARGAVRGADGRIVFVRAAGERAALEEAP